MSAWKCPRCGYQYDGPLRPCPECSKTEHSLAAPAGSAIHGATYHELDEANAKLCAENAALVEVMHWAQAVLTALNVGDIKSGSPLHLKLREVMIAYRAATEESPNDGGER